MREAVALEDARREARAVADAARDGDRAASSRASRFDAIEVLVEVADVEVRARRGCAPRPRTRRRRARRAPRSRSSAASSSSRRDRARAARWACPASRQPSKPPASTPSTRVDADAREREHGLLEVVASREHEVDARGLVREPAAEDRQALQPEAERAAGCGRPRTPRDRARRARCPASSRDANFFGCEERRSRSACFASGMPPFEVHLLHEREVRRARDALVDLRLDERVARLR